MFTVTPSWLHILCVSQSLVQRVPSFHKMKPDSTCFLQSPCLIPALEPLALSLLPALSCQKAWEMSHSL